MENQTQQQQQIVPPVTNDTRIFSVDKMSERIEMNKKARQDEEAKKIKDVAPSTIKEVVEKTTPKNDERKDTSEKQSDTTLKKFSTEETTPEQELEKIKNEKEKIIKEKDKAVEDKKKIEKKIADTEENTNWWESSAKHKKGKEQDTEEDKRVGVEKRLTELETKEKEYNDIMNDELIKAIYYARKSGKDITDILTDIRGVDVDKLTPADLYKIELKGMQLSDEEVEAEMDTFNDLSPARQRKETNHIKLQLQKENKEKLSKYTTTNQVEADKIKQQTEIFIKRAVEDKGHLFEKIKDTNYFGVKMTPSRIEEINTMITKGLNNGFYNEDGTYNVQFALEQSIWAIPELRKLIQETTYNKGVAKGREEILNEYNRGNSKRNEGLTTLPLPDEKKEKSALEMWKGI